MALVRNFTANPEFPNRISLSWDAPIAFADSSSEIIITKSITHFPSELFNEDFPTKATDSRPVEIFRGTVIAGTNTGTISVAGNTLTDSAASFPALMKDMLVRDSESKVRKITSNTATSFTVDGTIANGKYIILADYPTTVRQQENYEVDIRTTVGLGFISNLVTIVNSQLILKTFVPGELNNLIFRDGNGTKYLIKYNDETTIYFYEVAMPSVGASMAVLTSFVDSEPTPLIDLYKNQEEADVRVGTGLLDDSFYYYTAFVKPINGTIAQADYANVNNNSSTQTYAISTKDVAFGDILYSYWPEIHKSLDTTEDLYDLMQVFGWQFNQLYSYIKTYKPQDAEKVSATALPALSGQFGLPSIGFTIGADTLRRIAQELIYCWKLKGSKEGIAAFIRMITTWDITNGTAEYSQAIQDTLPNVSALRFYSAALGSANTRLTQTTPSFVPGGRFARGLPGIVIPGFFTFREFVVNLPNVALYIGSSEVYTTDTDTTTMTDSNANFGANNSLVGNYLLSNQQEPNDIFQIISNTATSITVNGIITNRSSGGKYAVLSPLNTNRFLILNSLMPYYIPFGTKNSYDFI